MFVGTPCIRHTWIFGHQGINLMLCNFAINYLYSLYFVLLIILTFLMFYKILKKHFFKPKIKNPGSDKGWKRPVLKLTHGFVNNGLLKIKSTLYNIFVEMLDCFPVKKKMQNN